MNLDNIQKESYELYCQYQDYCANLGIGIAQNYSMLKKQILEHHNRKISYDPKMMMFYTYLDNRKKIYCKTEEGLIDKLVSHYLKNCSTQCFMLKEGLSTVNAEQIKMELRTVDLHKLTMLD